MHPCQQELSMGHVESMTRGKLSKQMKKNSQWDMLREENLANEEEFPMGHVGNVGKLEIKKLVVSIQEFKFKNSSSRIQVQVAHLRVKS